MDAMRSVLSELLPDLFSDERFNSPGNFKRIERNVKKLSELAHGMRVGTFPTAGEDVSITFISGLLKEETLLALTHLHSGHKTHARRVLKTIPNFCIGCHTRSTGLDLSSLQEEVPKTLTSLERAEFFDATRQFDRALVEFEKILADPSIAQRRQLEWKRAAGHAIATAVRVKRDPDRALALVDLMLSSPAAPVYLKQEALQWKTSLQEWKIEQQLKTSTADALFKEARRLIAQARDLQEYPADRSADILYLRASAILHDFLSQSSGDENVGEALLLLGSCYETLQDLQLWSLHDLYFEACVRKFPHTSVARACYIRYEESMFFGYTGSGGTFLPAEVQKHLDELKKLAERKAED